MNNIYFTVGPSKIYPTIFDHIKIGMKNDVLSLNHRGKEFAKLFENVRFNLKRFLSIPQTHEIFFLSSATEGMERTIENCVDTYSFHFVNGSFSNRYFTIAKQLGKNAKANIQNFGDPFNFSEVNILDNTELICFTHSDTSTGGVINLNEVNKLKKKYPNILFAIDVVSSIPYPKIDFSVFDLVFFSVQKGFGLPAGLGVLIVSPHAMQKSAILEKKNKVLGSYHRFSELKQYADKGQTPETPNVLAIYLLSNVLNDMQVISIKTIRKQTEEKATILYNFFEKHPNFELFIKDRKSRSQTIIVVKVNGGSKELIEFLKNQGITIGKGYGEFKDEHIRIANFPSHTGEDIRKLIKKISEFFK